ncbi:MAG: hypothetical protein DRP09_14830 [Candidatus Thorarchaeota archaeon]|nr:MAG: hypothetical protein DRP09_14830 [Candidatus Thorarchaeota archaeon]
MIRRLKTLTLILFVVLSAFSFFHFPIREAKASPDWLSGWQYRKSHVVNSASGAGTNYQVRIKVHYESGYIDNVTFVSRSGDVDAHQGVCSDGTYLYTTQGSNIWENSYLKKWDKDWNLQQNLTIPDNSYDTDVRQVNSLCYKDGKLYVGANNFDTAQKHGWIFVYNASDLSYIEKHQVKDHYCEGCDYHDGYWWVVYHDWPYVSKYDSNWNWVADYALESGGEYEGIRWKEDYIYVNNHEGAARTKLDCYKWTGSGFELVKEIDRPSDYATQGISFDPSETDVMWWAERKYQGTLEDDRVVKTTINMVSDSGEDVYLNGHCRTDFGDVRFTDDDGTTLLDYWVEEKVDGNYAVFWVEVADDLSSTSATIYIYYGKSDATTTSNGDDTFPFFDDFDSDTSGDYTQDSGTWTWETSNSWLKASGDGANLLHHSTYLMETGYALRLKQKFDSIDTNANNNGAVFGFSDTNNFYMGRQVGDQDYFDTEGVQFYKKVSASWTKLANTSSTSVADQWYWLENKWLSATHVKVLVNDVEKLDITSGLESWTSGKIGIRAYLSTHTAYFDVLLVRKCVDPEPSHGSWGTEEEAEETNWLSGWSKRRQITIDHNDIDNDLTDFPVLLYLSANSGVNSADVTSIFDEIGSNSKKIAVTTNDGTTQCYVEIEKWDATNEEAWLWVKVPSISSSEDTVLYFYYDNSQSDNDDYVGNTNESPAQNVWNPNYKIVLHMNGSSYSDLKDSTSNNNDVNQQGGSPTCNTDGKIGKAVDFEESENEYLKATSFSLPEDSNHTVMVWVKLENIDSGKRHFICETDENFPLSLAQRNDATYGNIFQVYTHCTDGSVGRADSTTHPQVGQWYFVCGVVDALNDHIYIYVDGSLEATDTDSFNAAIKACSGLNIGTYRDNNGRFMDGIIDELKILDTACSSAWIKATYESERDDLVTWGTEEEEGQPTQEYTYELPSTLTITETHSKSWATQFSITNTIQPTSTFSKTASFLRSFTQTTQVLSSLTKSVGLGFSYAEQVGTTVQIVKGRESMVVTSEQTAVTTGFTKMVEIFSSFTQTVNVAEQFSRSIAVLFTHGETVQTTTQLMKGRETMITTSENIQPTSNMLSWLALQFQLPQTTAITETHTVSLEKAFLAVEYTNTETTQPTGTMFVTKALQKSFAETVLTSASTAFSKALQFISENIIHVTGQQTVNMELYIVSVEFTNPETVTQSSTVVVQKEIGITPFETIIQTAQQTVNLEVIVKLTEAVFQQTVIVDANLIMHPAYTRINQIWALAALGVVLALIALAVAVLKRD